MAVDRRPGDIPRSTVVDIEQPSVREDEPPGCSTVTPGGPPAGALIGPVVSALRAHSNPVRGFGHALEPDIRSPASEPSARLPPLVVLAEVGVLDNPMVGTG
jgi:hypothetical protein